MMDLPPLLTTADLSRITHYSVATIEAWVYRSPEKLPPRVPHFSRPLWHQHVVDEWLRGQAQTVKRPGRRRA